jgi:2-hydroxychromene-2-carboxylate isomerase
MTDDLNGARDTVDFWFDPLCGWSWISSRWILEAAKVRQLDITWRPFSLAMNGGDEEVPPEGRRLHELAKRFARTVAAVCERCGAHAVGPFYTALGSRVHWAGGQFASVLKATPDTLTDARVAALEGARPVIEAALAETGLPADLVTAMDAPEWDDWLRAAHAQVQSGRFTRQLMGVPMLSVNGTAAVFGPVMGEGPRGEAAGELWDAFRVLALADTFFEFKRAVARPQLREFLGS